MRRPIIAGNWKMNKTIRESLSEIEALKPLVDGAASEVRIYPSFLALKPCADALQRSNISVGAQNMHFEEQGAFTGEISFSMVLEVTKYVLIGHSERRQYYNETDDTVNKKMTQAVAHGLLPTMCIGETLEQREKGKTLDIIRSQIEKGLEGFDVSMMQEVVIAYEPIWAIGTGKTASNEQAEEVHSKIRGILTSLFGDVVAANTRILYGGSVKPENIKGLMSMDNIDGGLVGGASLKAEIFADIVNFDR